MLVVNTVFKRVWFLIIKVKLLNLIVFELYKIDFFTYKPNDTHGITIRYKSVAVNNPPNITIPIEPLSKILGHENVAITQRYIASIPKPIEVPEFVLE